MEVYVKCAECHANLEEHKVEKEYSSDAVIYVTPCDCVRGEE